MSELSKGDLARIATTLTDAESVPVPPVVRALIVECRGLCVAYGELRQAHRDAVELATMRFEVIAKYAKDNERIIGQNLRLSSAAERRGPGRRKSA